MVFFLSLMNRTEMSYYHHVFHGLSFDCCSFNNDGSVPAPTLLVFARSQVTYFWCHCAKIPIKTAEVWILKGLPVIPQKYNIQYMTQLSSDDLLKSELDQSNSITLKLDEKGNTKQKHHLCYLKDDYYNFEWHLFYI